MGTDCPFAILGVAEDATRDELSHAFRSLARRTHPDHGGEAAEFRRAVAAYREACRRVAARPVRRAADPYRSFLVSLDAAARLTVRPATVARRSSVAGPVDRPVPATAQRFAAVLADVLAAA